MVSYLYLNVYGIVFSSDVFAHPRFVTSVFKSHINLLGILKNEQVCDEYFSSNEDFQHHSLLSLRPMSTAGYRPTPIHDTKYVTNEKLLAYLHLGQVGYYRVYFQNFSLCTDDICI